MLRWTKWVAPMAALVLMAGIQASPTRADDTTPPAPANPPALTGKATITVTVVDGNGAPVPDAKVSLMPPRAKHQKGGATTQPDGSTPPPAHKGKPTPLESGVSGADGTFALTNVPRRRLHRHRPAQRDWYGSGQGDRCR